MTSAPRFDSIDALLAQSYPSYPVTCIHPDKIQDLARQFQAGFSGTSLYAVKCNPHPLVLDALWQGGIRHFDTASLSEIALIKERFPDAVCWFHHPVKRRAAIETAHKVYGVDRFSVDHIKELDKIDEEIPGTALTICVRLATTTSSAIFELSSKFGASYEEAVALLQETARRGHRPGLAFHVGSQTGSSEDYREAIRAAADIAEKAGIELAILNVGGGFPAPYAHPVCPDLDDFFTAIRDELSRHESLSSAQLICEPGRALVADGASILLQVVLRKDLQLYVNDGVYGNFNEYKVGGIRGYSRAIGNKRDLSNAMQGYELYGPTCDSYDLLPGRFDLPDDIDEGDWILFSHAGAYTTACTTDFNGFHPNTVVEVKQSPF